MSILLKIFVFLIVLFPFSAKADLFTITLTQGVNTATKGFTSVLDVFDKFEKGELDSILAGYNKNNAATGRLDFRGIEMHLNYTGAGANSTLTFQVPALGINKEFGGAGTQDQAFKEFKDY